MKVRLKNNVDVFLRGFVKATVAPDRRLSKKEIFAAKKIVNTSGEFYQLNGTDRGFNVKYFDIVED